MVKGFRQIALLTATSRVFGLIRDITYSHFLGANRLLDAWVIAFKIPNLSRRLFGEGAASASFIPVYSEVLQEDRDKAADLANTVVTVQFVFLAAVVLLAELAIAGYYHFFAATGESRLVLSLTCVMLPYMVLVCVVALIAGVLNVHRHFAAPAAAPIVLNIFIITGILLTGVVFDVGATQQLFWVAVAVLLAGVAQLAIQIPPLRRAGVSIRPAWKVRCRAFRKVILLMAPMIIGLSVTQINTLADDLIGWWFSGSEEKGSFFTVLGTQIAYPMWRGSVSYLYFAQRLYQWPLGVFGIALATAVFPVMSSSAARGDIAALRRTISRGLRSAVFLALPSAVGLIIVGRPLVATVFQHGEFGPEDTAMVTGTLFFYALGLFGYFTQQIAVRALYSLQDSRTPARSAVIAVAVNIVLNLTLIWLFATGGLAFSTALCSYLQVGILMTILHRRLGAGIGSGLFSAVGKTVVATAIMALVAVAAMWLSRGRSDIVRLCTVVPLAAAAYLAAARLLRIEMLSLLKTPGAEETEVQD